MAEGLNRVMLLGNLGAEPELRFTQGGQAVLNIRVATTESYLDKDRVRKERTDWHNVVVWGKRGEALAKILSKGSSVFVEGSLRTSSYDDRDGHKRYKTEVVASNILLTGGRSRGAPAEEGAPSYGGEYEGGGAGSGGGGGRAPSQNAYNRANTGGGSYGGGRPGGGSSRGAPPPPADPGPPPDDYFGGGGGDDDIPF